MDQISLYLHVYFDGQFWIDVFEETKEETMSVCKIVFGQEPQMEDIFQWIGFNYAYLKWSPSVVAANKSVNLNPKRKQRLAKQLMLSKGMGTKSQQALKLQHEECKQVQKELRKERDIKKKQQKFELQQHKKKEKHKGH